MYATGSATTCTILMDAFLAFAVANAGMTEAVRRTETISSQSHTVVCLSKGGRYWWFRYRSNTISMKPATSSGGTTWSNIPSGPATESRIEPVFEPFTSYHFFTEGTVCHLAVEMSNGSYFLASFGDVTKFGTWTGGHYTAVTNTAYTSSSFYNNTTYSGHSWLFTGGSASGLSTSNQDYSMMYVPYDGKDYALVSGTSNVTGYGALTTTGFTPGVYDRFVSHSPSAYNNRSPGLPVFFFLRDNMSGGSNLRMPLGYVPGIRLINIRNLNPKDVINTDWMVFPMQSKNVGLLNFYTNSGEYGWAIQQ